jgi:hypothetical protein
MKRSLQEFYAEFRAVTLPLLILEVVLLQTSQGDSWKTRNKTIHQKNLLHALWRSDQPDFDELVNAYILSAFEKERKKMYDNPGNLAEGEKGTCYMYMLALLPSAYMPCTRRHPLFFILVNQENAPTGGAWVDDFKEVIDLDKCMRGTCMGRTKTYGEKKWGMRTRLCR